MKTARAVGAAVGITLGGAAVGAAFLLSFAYGVLIGIVNDDVQEDMEREERRVSDNKDRSPEDDYRQPDSLTEKMLDQAQCYREVAWPLDDEEDDLEDVIFVMRPDIGACDVIRISDLVNKEDDEGEG